MSIIINNITVAYNNTIVLQNISLQLPSQQIVGVLGPNGAGKSTLLKTIIGLIKPQKGVVTIFNKSAHETRKQVAYIPQRASVDWDFPTYVLDVVLMGRYVHLKWFERPKSADIQKAWDALEIVGLTALAYHPINELSGGQQQRVFVARALVQEPDIFLMDEPFAAIDYSTQDMLLNLFKYFCKQGKSVIIVHHDLYTAQHYFDYIVLLNKKVIAHDTATSITLQHYQSATLGVAWSDVRNI